MIPLNIVVEGARDAMLLKLLFSMRFPQIEASFYATGSRVNAAALASSVLAGEPDPVLLVRDANTQSKQTQKEQDGLASSLMRQSSPEDRFRIFSFRPEMEIIFWEMGDDLADLSAVAPIVLAKEGPKAALNTHLKSLGSVEDLEDPFDGFLALLKVSDCWESSEQIRKLIAVVNSILEPQVANV